MLMRPSSIDEFWEALKLEFHAQKREFPPEYTEWYKQRLEELRTMLAKAIQEGHR
jgi:hypothetical protein